MFSANLQHFIDQHPMLFVAIFPVFLITTESRFAKIAAMSSTSFVGFFSWLTSLYAALPITSAVCRLFINPEVLLP
jgi:hypothetical protein